MSNEKRAPDCLVYIGDYTTQFYVETFDKPWNKDPVINQPFMELQENQRFGSDDFPGFN